MLNTWRIIFESLAVLFLILGFIYEEKVIEFENNIKRIVIGNYKRIKRSLKR